MAAATATMLPGRPSCQLRSSRPAGRFAPLLPAGVAHRVARCPVAVHAGPSKHDLQAQTVQALSVATAASTFLAAGNASAATEMAQLAAGDNRLSIIALLFAPAVGWVLFNIGQPALNQLNSMGNARDVPKAVKPMKGKKRSVAVGLGLTAASMLAAEQADAATEIAQLAAGDNRLGIIALLFAPAVGWVLFNIGQPALNQLNSMGNAKDVPKAVKPMKGKKRSVAAGLGLSAASMLAAQQADAATEFAQLAAGDNRIGIIALLFAPAVGWVLFNIGGPALNQLNNMGNAKDVPKAVKPMKGKKRSVAAGIGLTAASLLAAQQADAATELAQLAASDNRIGIIATLFLPAIGWVLFNILDPARNQFENMRLK